MLIFIKNSPRTYAWGSRDALPEALALTETGEPQAELWLGDHEGGPAQVSGGMSEPMTLIDLIESNPEACGVDGGNLPFLLKVLGIGAPLSLQVHPSKAQAEAGFADEEARQVSRSSPERSYSDTNHKPELLVALTEVRALSGFRDLSEVKHDVSALAVASGSCGAEGSQAMLALAQRVIGAMRHDPKRGREELIDWAFSEHPSVAKTIRALTRLAQLPAVYDLHPDRLAVLRELTSAHPGDPGIVLSLLMHHVTLTPGEAVFLAAGELHAYLSGVGVEVMASSDNVLRAGLTEKHVNVAEFRRVVKLDTNDDPRFAGATPARGLTTWQPPVDDFVLHRVRVHQELDDLDPARRGEARAVQLEARYPLVMIVTDGFVRVERQGAELNEVATARKGHSLYISAGAHIECSGTGEAFLATVGARPAKGS